MENVPGEQVGKVMPGEFGGTFEAAQNGPVGLGEAAREALGSAALMTAEEIQRPAEAQIEGLQDGFEGVVPASEALVEAPVAEIGTVGVDGEDVIRDAQGDFMGTDKPEKRRAVAERMYVEKAQETKKLVETDPKAAADRMTAESWEYMRVMFGRQMGDGITGQKGGLAA